MNFFFFAPVIKKKRKKKVKKKSGRSVERDNERVGCETKPRKRGGSWSGGGKIRKTKKSGTEVG